MRSLLLISSPSNEFPERTAEIPVGHEVEGWVHRAVEVGGPVRVLVGRERDARRAEGGDGPEGAERDPTEEEHDDDEAEGPDAAQLLLLPREALLHFALVSRRRRRRLLLRRRPRT